MFQLEVIYLRVRQRNQPVPAAPDHCRRTHEGRTLVWMSGDELLEFVSREVGGIQSPARRERVCSPEWLVVIQHVPRSVADVDEPREVVAVATGRCQLLIF